MNKSVIMPRKREIIISIDDYCNEPFRMIDIEYWNDELSKMLMDYDIEITEINVKDKITKIEND